MFHRRTEKAFQGHSEAHSISLQHRHRKMGVHCSGQDTTVKLRARRIQRVWNERVATVEEKRKISIPIATTIGTGHHQFHVYHVWSSLSAQPALDFRAT